MGVLIKVKGDSRTESPGGSQVRALRGVSAGDRVIRRTGVKGI